MSQTAEPWPGHSVPGPDDTPFLAADIGGTHARFGLVRCASPDDGITILAYDKYTCAEHASLQTIMQDFLDRHAGADIRQGVLACAGYELDGVVINDNLPWRVSLDELRRHFKLADLALINDFEALAYATRHVRPGATMALAEPDDATGEGAQVLVGPGTGLGSAVLFSGGPKPHVMATEAGQIALAPGTAYELEIFAAMAKTRKYVSCEDTLSGRGLINLYQTICSLDGATPSLDKPQAITTAALAGDNDQAVRSVNVFCALLGSYAGDLALLYGASGGIWLAGGILPHIHEALARSDFMARFVNKGSMRPFLQRVPVRLLDHGKFGVIGAADWYKRTADAGVNASSLDSGNGHGG
ncbi:MAG TPA: glucokinase [Oleiagrimonas sp.]|nr:glucokinase [Oleiagrimonas sp.]